MGDIVDFKEKTERIIKEKERLKDIETTKNILKRIIYLIPKKEESEIPPDNPSDVA